MSQDPTDQLRAVMARFNLRPPEDILWDGRLHRFPGTIRPVEKNDKLWGIKPWYLAFPGRKAARFGDFHTDVNRHWVLQRDDPVTPNEKKRWAAEKANHDREQTAERERALDQVLEVWNAAEIPSPKHRPHPYLFDKEITSSPGLRVSRLTILDKRTNFHVPAGLLLVPMLYRGKIVNIQRIWPDRMKKYWPKAQAVGTHVALGTKDADWTGIVLGWSYFFGQSEGKAKVDSDWV